MTDMEVLRDELILFARLKRNVHMEAARNQRLLMVATRPGKLRDGTEERFKRHVRLAREYNRLKLRLTLGAPLP